MTGSRTLWWGTPVVAAPGKIFWWGEYRRAEAASLFLPQCRATRSRSTCQEANHSGGGR